MDIVGRSLFCLLINMYLNNLKYVGALKISAHLFCICCTVSSIKSYAQETVEQTQNQAKPDKVVRVAVTGSRISKAQKMARPV